MKTVPASRARERATRWGLALWLIAVAMTGLFVVLVILNRGSPGTLEFDTAPLFTALYAVVVLIFSSVGGLIVARRPENRIGWLFSFTGLATITGICAQLYGDQALFDQPGNLPGGEWPLWVSSWLIAQTTDAFGARLRNEVRLDEVAGDLLGVVHRILQPSHTSLWLAPEGDER